MSLSDTCHYTIGKQLLCSAKCTARDMHTATTHAHCMLQQKITLSLSTLSAPLSICLSSTRSCRCSTCLLSACSASVSSLSLSCAPSHEVTGSSVVREANKSSPAKGGEREGGISQPSGCVQKTKARNHQHQRNVFRQTSSNNGCPHFAPTH